MFLIRGGDPTQPVKDLVVTSRRRNTRGETDHYEKTRPGCGAYPGHASLRRETTEKKHAKLNTTDKGRDNNCRM